MMSKEERENIEIMTRGLEPLPKALGIAILTPIAVGLYFAVYAIVSVARGDSFATFDSHNVTYSMLILLGILILTRSYGDWFALKITGQYNESTLTRGMRIPKLGVLDRVKQFIPTMSAWKWLLVLWVVANALDCLSTYLGLHYGAQEANPSAREASNMYLSKWIGVIFLTVIAVYWQWKPAMKFLTTAMFLVALSNFVVLGMALVQPSLTDVKQPNITTPAFMIQLAEMAIIAVVILWGRDMWDKVVIFYRERIRRENAVS